MGRTGVTVATAMLATSVRIDAGVEADIGAVVGAYNRSGTVLEIGGAFPQVNLGQLTWIEFDAELSEAVAGIEAGTATRMAPNGRRLNQFVFGLFHLIILGI